MWSRSRGIDIIWTNIMYNTMSNQWERNVVFQQNFADRNKKLAILFLAKVFHRVFHRVNHLVKIMPRTVEKRFFYTKKCKCMNLNIGTGIPICVRNGHVFPYSISNPNLF